MRQCEFKRKHDPDLGRYVKKHIHGEGIMGVLKSVTSKMFGKTTKSIAKKAATKAIKTGEFAGNKAGDKIIQLLSREKQPVKVSPVVSLPMMNQLSEKELKILKQMEMAESTHFRWKT